MVFRIDPELGAAMAAGAAAFADIQPPPRGDYLALRALTDGAMAAAASASVAVSASPDVRMSPYATQRDGAEIPLRWYTRERSLPGSAAVFVHGGGMVCGGVELFDSIIRHYVQLSGVPLLAVDYRLAPENPGTGPAEDVLAALTWLLEQAGELEVDPARVGIIGESAGGGVGAGAAILARDKGIAVAKQILVCPMLDDRNLAPDPLLAGLLTWDYDSNFTGWNALLGDQLGGPDVSPYAAPARLFDFAALAPAYIEVGEVDLFRDESISYAQRLLKAGVSCELTVRPGAPHGFEFFNQESSIGRRVFADRARALRSI
jgi:acetyl esterase/lipase